MSIYFIVPTITFLSYLCLFIYIHAQKKFIYFNEKKLQALNSCLLILFSLIVWSSVDTLSWLPFESDYTLNIIKVASVSWLSLSFLFIHFVFLLTNKKTNHFCLYLVGLINISFWIDACFTDNIFNNLIYINSIPLLSISKHYYFALIFSVLLPSLYGLFLLLKYYIKNKNSKIIKPIRMLLYFSLLTIFTVSLLFLFGPIIEHGSYVISSASSALILYPLAIYLAINKYNLLSATPEEAINQLLINIRDGIIITNNEGNISQMNNAASKFLIFDTYKINSINFENFLSQFIKNKISENEFEIQIQKGNKKSLLHISRSKIANDIDVEKGYLYIMKDLTERENLQKQFIHSSKLASIGTLAAGIAHEINNPLQILSGCVDILTDCCKVKGFADDNKVAEKMFNTLHDSIERISNIVNGLRTYARADTDHVEEFMIHDIIFDSISIVKVMFEKKNIEIIQNLEAKNSIINGNRGKLQQVIMNLISNARDALEGNLNGKILIKTKNEDDNSILFEVIDNGTGINEEDIDKIFDSFYTTKDPGKGTGLGLGISYSIIKSMNGSIYVQSIPNVETKFSIVFPTSKV